MHGLSMLGNGSRMLPEHGQKWEPGQAGRLKPGWDQVWRPNHSWVSTHLPKGRGVGVELEIKELEGGGRSKLCERLQRQGGLLKKGVKGRVRKKLRKDTVGNSF